LLRYPEFDTSLWGSLQLDLNYRIQLYPHDIKERFNVKEMMTPLVQTKYYPVLKVTQPDPVHVRISLESYDLFSNHTIPITYIAYNDGKIVLDSNITWLRPYRNERYVDLSANISNGWIIINIEEAGEYS